MANQKVVARKAPLDQVTIDRRVREMDNRIKRSVEVWLTALRRAGERHLKYYASFEAPVKEAAKAIKYPPNLGFTDEHPSLEAKLDTMQVYNPFLGGKFPWPFTMAAHKPPYMAGTPGAAATTMGTDPFPGADKIIEYCEALPASGQMELLAMTWPTDATADWVGQNYYWRTATACLYPPIFTVPVTWNQVSITAYYDLDGNSYINAIPPFAPKGWGMVKVRVMLYATVIGGYPGTSSKEAKDEPYCRFYSNYQQTPLGVENIKVSNGSLKVTLPALPGDSVMIGFSATLIAATTMDPYGDLIVSGNLSHNSNMYQPAGTGVTVPYFWITQ
jgi:hypothetical protein